jgi:putative transcriptional regulator
MGLTTREREKREKEQYLKAFGAHVRKVRLEKGISAAEFGRRAFIERSNIARLEMGRMNPTLYTLRQLSEALEMTLQEFLKDFDGN